MDAPRYDADLTIPFQFRGPAQSGNGGYTAGTLAERVATSGEHPVVEVTLRQPPPLDVAMKVEHLAKTVLRFGGAKIAEAHQVDAALEPVDPVSMTKATDAMSRFPGLVSHPFPTCFACGPDRTEGDGLRIFPGKVVDALVASLWLPHENFAESGDLLNPGVLRVGVGTAWAALDCIGGWAGDMEERKMVLGRMTAQVYALPAVDEPHVVVGKSKGSQGRKTFTASTLYDSDGRVVALAEHVWIAIDPAAFN